jgi:hypothetical protein
MADLDDYHSRGMTLAIKLLGIPDDTRLDAQGVRDWIEVHVDRQDGVLVVTVADFWLSIDKHTGPTWRLWSYPINPWLNVKRAPRFQVEDWYEKCVEREGVVPMDDALAGKQDAVNKRLRAKLREKHPWLVTMGPDRQPKKYKSFIVGNVGSISEELLDRAFPDPNTLNIEFLTLGQALRRPWFDREERIIWLRVLGWLHTAALEEQRQAFDEEYSAVSRLALMDRTGKS